MNILDYVILLGMAIWLVVVMRYIIKQKKAGGCVGCSEADTCMKNKQSLKGQQLFKDGIKKSAQTCTKKHLS